MLISPKTQFFFAYEVLSHDENVIILWCFEGVLISVTQ